LPGLVGIITKLPPLAAKEQLTRMVGSLLHEQFYVSGTWADEDLGVYVGWVARKNSFSEAMPIRNEAGDVTLLFSGEDYPDPSIASELRKRGHACELSGPSYLVHLYEESKDFFKNLNGRFHGLVVDKRNGTLTLFNDRFGLQRLNYHEAADAFYFAAETKAILAVVPKSRALDSQSLGEYIACGCVLENRTLFQNVFAMPPASEWQFRNSGVESKGQYFEPQEWERQEPLDPEGYYSELRNAFTSRLPRYFNGKEQIGVSLTGGLDTRIIMAWRKAPPGTLPCYTFGSMYRENQDVYLAKRVAQICNQPYQVVTVDEKVLSRFPHYAERTLYLTDGCVDVSRSADLYNNEMARQIAPVRMVGTFGSEIIRGDVMFKAVLPKTDVYEPELLSHITSAMSTYRNLLQGNRKSVVAFRQPAAYHFGVLMLEQTQLTIRAPYLDNEIVRTVFQTPTMNQGEDVRMRLIRDGSRELARLRTDRGLGDSDPISSAINRAYLEFTFKAEYAYDYGMPQWVARTDHLLSPLHLERLWMGRHKLFHFRWWYRTVLAKYVQDTLLDPRALSRSYLKPTVVKELVTRHTRGTHNYTTEIHRLLSIELIHKNFIDTRD